MARTDINSTICITSGEPGAGKTLSRGVIYAVEVFLRDKVGIMYHNLPLKHELIADYLHTKYKKDRTEILNRLVFIPESVTSEWRENCFFKYFEGKDLHNAYVLIDEAHNYFGTKSFTEKTELRIETEQALSVFRHNGAKLELLTQSFKSIHTIVRYRAGYSISIINYQDYNDIIFGIKLRDWMQLKAKLLGFYTSASVQIENKVHEDKEIKMGTKIWWHNPTYYKMYNTHNSSEGSAGADTTKLKDTWQIKSWFGLICWFLRRNFFNLFIGTRLAFIGWCLLIFIFLGPKNLVVAWVHRVENAMVKPQKVETDKKNVSVSSTPGEDQKKKIEDEKLKLLREKNIDLELKLKEFEEAKRQQEFQEKKAKVITLIDSEGVLLNDGSYFNIGSTIDYGHLFGKQIEKIDIKQNRVYISGGIVVTIGYSLLEKTDSGTIFTRISEPVQNVISTGAETGKPKYTEVEPISNRKPISSPASELPSE